MSAWILHFFSMGGYGAYIWSAYGVVLFVLTLQWWLPWRRLRRYQQSAPHECHS